VASATGPNDKEEEEKEELLIQQITYHMQFVMPILSIHSWDLLDQGTLRGKPTLNPEEPTLEPRKMRTKIAQALKIR